MCQNISQVLGFGLFHMNDESDGKEIRDFASGM